MKENCSILDGENKIHINLYRILLQELDLHEIFVLFKTFVLQPTNLIELSPSWEANSHSPSQKILRLVRNSKFYLYVQCIKNIFKRQQEYS